MGGGGVAADMQVFVFFFIFHFHLNFVRGCSLCADIYSFFFSFFLFSSSLFAIYYYYCYFQRVGLFQLIHNHCDIGTGLKFTI